LSWFLDQISVFPEKIAVIDGAQSYSYADLRNQVDFYFKTRTQHAQPGEVVAILSDYSFHSISLFLALVENKNIIVPIVPTVQFEAADRLQEAFVDHVATFSGPNVEWRHTKDVREKHILLKDLKGRHSAGLILFSSGSTGTPKAMIHDLGNVIDSFKNKTPKNLNMIVFLMFDHIGGINTLLNIFAMSATCIVPQDRKNVEHICQLIETYKINILPSSPTFLNLILVSDSHHKYDLSHLRMITYGTEIMPEPLLKRLKEAFPRTRFLQTFGTSETGISQTKSQSSGSLFMKLDDPNIEHKIVEGELWLKSKTQVLGYLNASMENFTSDGWFKTGDLVESTTEGFIKIIGRNKEVINVGGEKVLPSEIESVILEMPEIDDVMVYGEKNVFTGQSVVCDVVVKSGVDKKDVKRLVRTYCRSHLEAFKLPTKVNVVEQTNFSDRFKKIRNRLLPKSGTS
jgi:acyl-CoA synthetase (AMP-forming)/AMP-acid ligase II